MARWNFDGYIFKIMVVVEIDGKSIYENRMDYELCLKTANMLEELHCDYMIATANHLYTLILLIKNFITSLFKRDILKIYLQ